MIAGRKRANLQAPILQSPTSSEREPRTARENGAMLAGLPTESDRERARDLSCRDCFSADWAVESFRDLADVGFAFEQSEISPACNPPDRPRPARKLRGISLCRLELWADVDADGTVTACRPACTASPGCSCAVDESVAGRAEFAARLKAASRRQSPELRALGRHLRRRALNEKGNADQRPPVRREPDRHPRGRRAGGALRRTEQHRELRREHL